MYMLFLCDILLYWVQIFSCRVSSRRWRRSLGHLVRNPDPWRLFLAAWKLECLVRFFFSSSYPGQLIFITTKAKVTAVLGQTPGKTQTGPAKLRRFKPESHIVRGWVWAKVGAKVSAWKCLFKTVQTIKFVREVIERECKARIESRSG